MHSAPDKLPLLYSFRRCPYAIRARMMLLWCGQTVRIREVLLRDKPDALRAISAKATVPVMQLSDGTVLTESLDIMHWALAQSNRCDAMFCDDAQGLDLIESNDHDFKSWLDRYKYFDRHPEHSQIYYRDQCAVFLQRLEGRLADSQWLLRDQPTFADFAIMPFIRQFAAVERSWFEQSEFRHLRGWLAHWLQQPVFLKVMDKYPVWQPGAAEPLLAVDHYEDGAASSVTSARLIT